MQNTRDKNKIADDIRLEREKINLTQEQFAELLGVSTRTVGRWENGESFPIKHVDTIAAVLNVSQKELLTRLPQNDSEMENVSASTFTTDKQKHNDITRMFFCFAAGVAIVGVVLLAYLYFFSSNLLHDFIFTLYCFFVMCITVVWMICYLLCELNEKRRSKGLGKT